MAVSKQRATGVSQTESRPELACQGETMNTAETATYAYDQIDQARAELNTVVEIDDI
jgi:hypothetical protein